MKKYLSGQDFTLESASNPGRYVVVVSDSEVALKDAPPTKFFLTQLSSTEELYKICSLDNNGKCLRHKVTK